ncbi:MAG: 4a-hydroxytetrahydrobiopterin dehydratase [Balneolaceae bacterium]
MDSNVLNLQERKCKACSPDTPPLEGEELRQYHNRLEEGWDLSGEHHLERVFKFKNFRQALDFTVKVGEMSEEEGHHPDIVLKWGEVKVIIYTHAIEALSESDFIWAAKADGLYAESRD